MGDISKHFDRKEFACRCGCGTDTVDIELVEVLESIRAWARIQNPTALVFINCGVRCLSHNKPVGGVRRSYHLLAKAADIRVGGLSPKEVAGFLDERFPDKYGVGLYSTFTHIDVRSEKARWKH